MYYVVMSVPSTCCLLCSHSWPWLNRSMDILRIMRTIPNIIASLLTTFEDAIRLQLIPVLTGYDSYSSNLRDLLALPCRLGGMGIISPTDVADSHLSRLLPPCKA